MAAILVPSTGTPANSALWFGDGDQRVVVTHSGRPVVPKDSGETETRRWEVYESEPSQLIQATWITPEGTVRQGLKARGLTARILLTERTLRIGMARPGFPKKGPYVCFDSDKTMSTFKADGVYGLTFRLEDTETIVGSRSDFYIGDSMSGISLTGITHEHPLTGQDFKPEKCRISDLGAAVTRNVIAVFLNGNDESKRRAAISVHGDDYVTRLSKRASVTYDFGPGDPAGSGPATTASTSSTPPEIHSRTVTPFPSESPRVTPGRSWCTDMNCRMYSISVDTEVCRLCKRRTASNA